MMRVNLHQGGGELDSVYAVAICSLYRRNREEEGPKWKSIAAINGEFSFSSSSLFADHFLTSSDIIMVEEEEVDDNNSSMQQQPMHDVAPPYNLNDVCK